ncbi:uncharacterized protein M6D78_016636 [Vipera latastei]
MKMLIFFSSFFWPLQYVRGASLAPAVGDPNIVHWNDWQPWVCMCQLHKQARIRHFAVWGANVSLDLRTSEFWQEKPCSLQECSVCRSEDCPGSVVGSGFLSRFQSLSSPRPHEVKIPLPPHLDFPSYDSLPVIDDKDGE